MEREKRFEESEFTGSDEEGEGKRTEEKWW